MSVPLPPGRQRWDIMRYPLSWAEHIPRDPTNEIRGFFCGRPLAISARKLVIHSWTADLLPANELITQWMLFPLIGHDHCWDAMSERDLPLFRSQVISCLCWSCRLVKSPCCRLNLQKKGWANYSFTLRCWSPNSGWIWGTHIQCPLDSGRISWLPLMNHGLYACPYNAYLVS